MLQNRDTVPDYSRPSRKSYTDVQAVAKKQKHQDKNEVVDEGCPEEKATLAVP